MKSRLLALTLAIPLGLAALSGCSSTSGGGGDSTNWPADVEKNFMTSCESASGGQTVYCECSLDALKDEYTIEEYTQLEKDIMKDSSKGEELTDIIASCQDKVK